MRIKKTKLIYRFDLLNPTSFHEYVDGVFNMLMIVRTKANCIFGAFSTSKMEAHFKESTNTESFIFTFNSDLNSPITCFNLD